MIKKLLFPLFGLALLACGAATAAESDPLAEAFEAADMPPAFMSAINVDTGESMTRTFGYDDSGDQIFRIASMTKTVTTVAALQLVEQRRVGLDEPLAPILPALAEAGILNANCERVAPELPVTLRHLLSHTSGFGYAFTSDRLKACGYEAAWDPAVPRVFEAGSGFLYGRGIGWAGLLVEALSGQTLEDYFRENISGPLGLDRTWFDVPPELQGDIVDYGFVAPDDSPDGYAEERQLFPDRVPTTASNQYGGGSLFSSPNDYRRFLAMVANGGELDGVRILGEAMVDEMFVNQLPDGVTRDAECLDPTLCVPANFAASNDVFGLGFALEVDGSGQPTSRVYWGGIFNSYFTIDRERNIAVVYFSQYLPYAHDDAYRLYRLFEAEAFDRLEPETERLAREESTTEIRLQESADGRWTVDFRFPEPQRAVVFRQSPEPYRSAGWVSKTEGVEVVTLGDTDVMLFDTPGREATFEIEPYTVSLEKAYTPFLAFTDGSWGVLEGQFRVSSASGRAAVEAFDGNGEGWAGPLLDYTLVIDSPRRIFHNGEWADGALRLEPKGNGTYLYVGDAEIQQGENFAGFVDGGLPEWIRVQLHDDLPRIFDALGSEWGFVLSDPVEILFVLDGTDEPGLHQTGGAMGRQIALQVSGDALLEPDTWIADYFRWFLIHESVHTFQGAAGMSGVSAPQSWMHEGVANTMAHRVAGRLAGDRNAFLQEVYGQAFADCVGYLDTGAALEAAFETGQFGVYYACGDFIALLTEAWLADGDIFDFWSRFLGEASSRGDETLSVDLYFELAAQRGLSDAQVGQLRALIEAPVADPRERLTALLDAAGLEPAFDPDGRLVSLALPE